MTNGDKNDTIITEDDRKAVDRLFKDQWYIIKDKQITNIYPYHSDYVLTVKINGFLDYEIIDKKKQKAVGGE